MDRQEAVQTLSKVGKISVSYAENLYDSFFPKPVVPQCVAKWYEANKQNLDLNLCSFVFDLAMDSTDYYQEELKEWVNRNKKTFITTLVNMHQFGYEVEKKTRYTVEVKGFLDANRYLNHGEDGEFFFADPEETGGYRIKHTRKELEANGFGWVFDCEGVEVKEVTDE
jgi:hypothetical protein|nr:MAG TPA: Protein of unknown function (DUF1642) [Caudoviricetes sp.]